MNLLKPALLGSCYLLLAACSAGRLAAPAGEPVADPTGLADELQAATVPSSPMQVNFHWVLDEGGSRVSGRGVVRMESAARARLDLFGPRGETYLMAALVEGEYRLPTGASTNVPLPSPALLWSAIGVLAPPEDANLVSATNTSAGADLRFETSRGEVFAYTFEADPEQSYLLTRLERAGRQGIIESVNVDRDAGGQITGTRYRNWAEYRDLTLEIEEIREADPFSPDIWNPDASR